MKKLYFTILLLAGMLGHSMAQKAFIEGNVVVCRIGNGTETLAASGNNVYLDEYNVTTTPATLVQSFAITSGSDQLTMGGTLTYGGYLARSFDMLSLSLAGYTTTVPTIAVVDANGGIDLTTKLTAMTDIPRAAISKDGSSLWLTTATAAGKGGLYYTTKGAATTTEITKTTDKRNLCGIKIYNGRIFAIYEYVSTNSLALMFRWGTDFQKITTTGSASGACTTTASDFMMGGVHATSAFKPMVGYTADTAAAIGITKYSRGSSSYPITSVGSIGTGVRCSYYGITDYTTTDESVVLYATRYNKNNDRCELIRVTDVGGYANAPDVTVEVVATAAAGTVFKGVALAPIGGVNKESQTILNLGDIVKTYGDAEFTLGATASSELAISYTIGDPTIATVSGNTVQILKAGTTTIKATQAGDGTYSAASATVTLTINKASQTIEGLADITKTFGVEDNFTLSSTTSAGLTVTYQVADGTIASITDNKVQILALGVTSITANQAGNDNYDAFTATITLRVTNKLVQTIGNFAPITKTIGAADFELAATTTSGLAVSYSIADPTIASISGSTVHLLKAGTTTITATQPGDNTYEIASSTVALVVNKQEQTIGGFANITKTYGDADFALGATSTSNLPVVYTIADATVAMVTDGTVHIIGAGATTITATQAGSDIFGTATATVTLLVSKQSQTISNFTDISKVKGASDFTLTATAPGGTLNFTIANETIATITSGMVHILAIGTTTLTATQSGNDNYLPVTATITLTVGITAVTSVTKDNRTLVVFPNPATGSTVEVTFPETEAQAVLSLVSVSGNKILEKVVSKGSTSITIDVANLAKGIYIVSLADAEGKATTKLVK